MHYQTFAISLLLLVSTSAAPTLFDREADLNGNVAKKAAFPFVKIIAFGDDFTDNGQGSYAHNITGDLTTGAGAHLWGANTWTDGPVAVTDMAATLQLPITYDYAFGSSQGGAQIGSVCANGLLAIDHLAGHARLRNGALVPSATQQVANYTKSGVYNTDVANTLYFVWTGNNDMIASLGWVGRFTICDADTLCIPGQNVFIKNLMGCFENTLTTLLKAGAKHIMVPNIYPRQYAPWTNLYITQDPGMVANFGAVIDRTNAQIKNLTQALSTQYKAKVMYYDVNSYIKASLINSSMVQGATYIYTCVDGCTQQIPGNITNWNLYWNDTVVNKQPDRFYWMTTVMPSATVMRSIATDMVTFLTAQYQ